uniref:Uncharacterized protein n=1 Tax=Aegilops tauschii subsp. strangulata TaxID=200361 RepID=A0A452YJJ0_AEGTS
SGGASPRPAPPKRSATPTTTKLPVPASSSLAMPAPRLAHLRRLLSLHSPPPHPLAPSPARPLRPSFILPRAMAGAAQAGAATGSAEYEEVLGCLASLIKQKVRADTGNRGNQWELMAKYLQDTGAGGAHRAAEGGSRRRDQREGFNMHICRVNSSIMWFPHWTFHLSTLDRCP